MEKTLATFPFNQGRMLQCNIEKKSKICQEKDVSEIKITK